MLARSSVEHGAEVIICDVVGDRLAGLYRALLAEYDIRIVLLLPTWEESLRRLNARAQSITAAEARLLYDQQRQLTDFDGKIDNTHLSPKTVASQLAE